MHDINHIPLAVVPVFFVHNIDDTVFRYRERIGSRVGGEHLRAVSAKERVGGKISPERSGSNVHGIEAGTATDVGSVVAGTACTEDGVLATNVVESGNVEDSHGAVVEQHFSASNRAALRGRG